MTDPKVSVVMPVFNGEKYLGEAIDSILKQSFFDFEFIIINDASDDNTSVILNDYFLKDKRIVLIKNDNNMGLSSSLNKGLKMARGLYLARMDSDDIAISCRLKKQVSFLDNNPNVGMVGTAAYIVDLHGEALRKVKSSTDNEILKKALKNSNQFIHPSMMFRKECIQKVGGYREELDGSEDYDLWLRISEHFDIANLPEYLMSYRINPNSISVTKRLRQDALAEIAKELAIERQAHGSDRLQRGEIIKLNLPTYSYGRSCAKAYFSTSARLYGEGSYYQSFLYLLRTINHNPFNSAYITFLINNFFIGGARKAVKHLYAETLSRIGRRSKLSEKQ